ncbi:MAG: hypothetical protein QXM16_09185 [Nitrososphaerota archaeon]
MKTVALRDSAELSPKLRRHFPHQNPRPYQADLAESVYRNLINGSTNILLEGPTGLGKWGMWGFTRSP